jgi:uncharacterized protein (TIGR02466 family)
MEKQIASAYPTPIGRFRIPDAEAVNRELRRIILEHEQSDPGDNHANVGGWHSRADLLDWPGPEIGLLRGWITEALNSMLAATLAGKPMQGGLRVAAWANVARRGHYHRTHNHPMSAWSGVYYVAVGGVDPGHPLSGVLELCDPRPYAEMVSTPGDPFGQRAIFRPEPGMIVTFPGWLYHFVNPYYGPEERISIAFNSSWIQAGDPRAVTMK